MRTNFQKVFNDIYLKFKLNFYRSIFKTFETREASLTAIETFCVEAIYGLNKPTINELAEFINISQPNAAYKVSNLQKKGYINKIQSKEDKREYHLEVTEKFFDYYRVNQDYLLKVLKRAEEKFDEKEIEAVTKMFQIISNELMPEVSKKLIREVAYDE